MRDICHERGIPGLLVTHDLDATTLVDRVHTLRDGHMADGMDPELAATSS
jgi:ABC-type sulfate/molybdate transport systems ATPase subunit